DVSPEDGKGKHPLPKIVDVLDGHDALQGALAVPLEGDHDQSDQCVDGDERSAEDVHAEDGREPVRIEGHQQIVARQGKGYAEHRQPPPADTFLPGGKLGVRAEILLQRETVKPVGEVGPDDEVEDVPDQEKGRIKVRALTSQDGIVRLRTLDIEIVMRPVE